MTTKSTRRIKKKQTAKYWRARLVAAIFGRYDRERKAAARRAVARALGALPGSSHAH